MVPPREKIYRAEIFVTSRTTATDTRNGGDSVGECLHRELANCQLDISKDGRYFRRPIQMFASDNHYGKSRSSGQVAEV
jgi:hypothetical protein